MVSKIPLCKVQECERGSGGTKLLWTSGPCYSLKLASLSWSMQGQPFGLRYSIRDGREDIKKGGSI